MGFFPCMAFVFLLPSPSLGPDDSSTDSLRATLAGLVCGGDDSEGEGGDLDSTSSHSNEALPS
jgi:hypothetical protein